MTITGFGKVYGVYSAPGAQIYTKGQRAYEGFDERPCGIAAPRVAAKKSGAGKKPTTGADKKADKAQVASSYANMFYPADNTGVVVGSFFVTGPRHEKVSTGKILYWSNYKPTEDGEGVSEPPHGSMVIDPLTMDLMFDAHESY